MKHHGEPNAPKSIKWVSRYTLHNSTKITYFIKDKFLLNQIIRKQYD